MMTRIRADITQIHSEKKREFLNPSIPQAKEMFVAEKVLQRSSKMEYIWTLKSRDFKN